MIIYFISIVGFVFFSDAFKDAINGNENSCITISLKIFTNWIRPFHL